MTEGQKYDVVIVQQKDANWSAQITRQVTSKTVVISKQKNGFSSESTARQWGATELEQFAGTLSESNQRHGVQRKASEEQRRLRSSRRADKTAIAKAERLKDEAAKQQEPSASEADDDETSQSE